jgi:glycosyltransferase involved in cell wall biosynthesis
MLLESLALLPGPKPPLLLRGSGRFAAALPAQAERMGLDLRILPRLPTPDLVAAYNAATCVVHSSPTEPFGLVVAEAMACGRPVVAVGGGGPEEVLGDAGVITPPEDTAAFARQLQALLGDPARRAALGEAARRRVLERYSLERMQREYVEALEALCDAARR